MSTTTKPTTTQTIKTIGALFDAYISALPASGKSMGTARSYAADLTVAKRHFGKELPIEKLSVNKVQNYFASDAVTLTRKGEAKSKITSDKLRRVFRLAMTWAEAEGIIPATPVK